jgi:hypothetical protein
MSHRNIQGDVPACSGCQTQELPRTQQSKQESGNCVTITHQIKETSATLGVFETTKQNFFESTKMKERLKQDKPTDGIFAAKTTNEIIAIMKEEVEDEARQKILQRMTPACLEKIKYIETWFHKEVKHTLRSRYELGLQVRELHEDDQKGRQALWSECHRPHLQDPPLGGRADPHRAAFRADLQSGGAGSTLRANSADRCAIDVVPCACPPVRPKQKAATGIAGENHHGGLDLHRTGARDEEPVRRPNQG